MRNVKPRPGRGKFAAAVLALEKRGDAWAAWRAEYRRRLEEWSARPENAGKNFLDSEEEARFLDDPKYRALAAAGPPDLLQETAALDVVLPRLKEVAATIAVSDRLEYSKRLLDETVTTLAGASPGTVDTELTAARQLLDTLKARLAKAPPRGPGKKLGNALASTVNGALWDAGIQSARERAAVFMVDDALGAPPRSDGGDEGRLQQVANAIRRQDKRAKRRRPAPRAAADVVIPAPDAEGKSRGGRPPTPTSGETPAMREAGERSAGASLSGRIWPKPASLPTRSRRKRSADSGRSGRK